MTMREIVISHWTNSTFAVHRVQWFFGFSNQFLTTFCDKLSVNYHGPPRTKYLHLLLPHLCYVIQTPDLSLRRIRTFSQLFFSFLNDPSPNCFVHSGT